MTKQPDVAEKAKGKRAGEIEADEALFERLRALRRKFADERNVPAYVIFSDVALREMARNYPTTPAEFRRIPGVGEQKLKDFAEPFLAEIGDYLRSNARQTFAEPQLELPRRARLNESEAETLRRFQAGESIEAIARARGFVRGTICAHLVRAIESGAPLRMEQFFSKAQHGEIEPAFRRAGPANLVGLRDSLGGKYPIEELRIFRALTMRG